MHRRRGRCVTPRRAPPVWFHCPYRAMARGHSFFSTHAWGPRGPSFCLAQILGHASRTSGDRACPTFKEGQVCVVVPLDHGPWCVHKSSPRSPPEHEHEVLLRARVIVWTDLGRLWKIGSVDRCQVTRFPSAPSRNGDFGCFGKSEVSTVVRSRTFQVPPRVTGTLDTSGSFFS